MHVSSIATVCREAGKMSVTSTDGPVMGYVRSGNAGVRGAGDSVNSLHIGRRSPLASVATLGVTALIISVAEPAHAMHISEGILPANWAIFWTPAALPFLAWGLRTPRVRSQDEPHLKAMVGLVGAAVFVISCMPIPVPTAGT